MTEIDFTKWATSHGVPNETINAIIQYATSEEEMERLYKAGELSPPIYPLAGSIFLTDNDPCGISPHSHGFVLIGTTKTGDPIGIDVANQPGTVWYISHEMMFRKPIRDVSVKVAEDLHQMMQRTASGDFPRDYFDAINKK